MSNLTPRLTFGALDLTDYPYGLGFDEDLGSPEVVYEIISSQLADGEIVSSDRVSNRSLALTVLVEGGDLQELSDAEAALIAECDKAANTLSFDPGDGIGRTTVFETFRAQPRKVPSSAGEMSLVRRYEVTFPALPYPRSVDKVTDAAGAPPSSGTTVDDCESTAGWLSFYNASYGRAAPVTDAVIFAEGTKSVKCEAYTRGTGTNPYGYPYSWARNLDRKTLSVATGTGGYLSVLIRLDWPNGDTDNPSTVTIRQATAASPTLTAVTAAMVETVPGGFVRYAWPVAAGQTITELEFDVYQALGYASSVYPFVRYDQVRLSTAASTDSQIVKSFTVKGSVRGPGSLHIASPDDAIALGVVLGATVAESDVPPGFRPDVRRWVTAGTTVADTTAMHGSRYTAPASYSSTLQFEGPCTAFAPGNYSVVALVQSTGSNVGVEVQLTVGGVADGLPSATEQTVPASSAWAMVPLGTVRLAAISSPLSDAEYRVRIKGAGVVYVDEIFLIPEVAHFTIADCGVSTVGAGGSASHLWIDSPDQIQKSGGFWRGYANSRVNARKMNLATELRVPGLHVFKPGRMLAFVASTNADGPLVTLEYYPRWHTHAAE